MRLQVISDLHLSFNKNANLMDSLLMIDEMCKTDTYLMIAGDVEFLSSFSDAKIAFDFLSQNYNQVLVVLGNHDFYNTQFTNLSYSEILEQIHVFLLEYQNVHLLDKDIYEHDDFVILGCTLWSHIRTPVLRFLMADYICILDDTKEAIDIKHTNEWNRECVDWLTKHILKFSGVKPIIVMTHHLPVDTLVQKKWQKSVYCEAYANKMSGLLEHADVWICGHSHTGKREVINGCLCVMNPYGYQFHTKKTKKTTDNANFCRDCFVDLSKSLQK